MNYQPETLPIRWGETTVESDGLTTMGSIAFLVLGCLLLVTQIRHLVWGDFVWPARIHRDFFGIPTVVYVMVPSILCFAFVFELPKKPRKVGCFLMGRGGNN